MKHPCAPSVTAAVLALSCASFAAGRLTDEVEPIEAHGFAFEVSTEVPVPPPEAFEAFTGDVSDWWDHSFSAEPHRLFIEPRVGGGFYELFDDEGGGVLHARVTFVERGKKLVLTGPLGFHGKAFELVNTILFEPAEAGTRVTATVRGMGDALPEHGAVVREVWTHFLVERFRPYVERGGHRAKSRGEGH